MSQFLMTIAGGLIVAFLASNFGFGGSTKVTIHGGQSVKRTGKWMMIISILMILGGLAWAGSTPPIAGGIDFKKPEVTYGLTLAGYGVLIFVIGRIVAWFQKL